MTLLNIDEPYHNSLYFFDTAMQYWELRVMGSDRSVTPPSSSI